ncbi:LysR family transcriptional regulator [Microbulbifer agarilyticus]|uniref:LysR family transcriptional regulator n=1 Tax=Microbulbifer agarilyticus TaxID=260552 RepID=UPI001CD79C2F|nr:LysR family transcriptional regulator [Microbulbifer agarilyticus]MCA0894359.1 LysR family transcriptional regulator [Microbulbifer agarilyticus]
MAGPSVKDWNNLHYALAVAKAGTLSGAALELDVSHSTVLRRIDALEKALKTRLFIRHPRGYVPTEAGRMLMGAAENMQDQLDLLVGKMQGVDETLQGSLVITTVGTLIPMLMPIVRGFQRKNPQLRLELVADSRQLRLEHGEAHIGIRPGAKPSEPDYVVQKAISLYSSLYASAAYLRECGPFQSLEQVAGHRFVAPVDAYDFIPSLAWIARAVPEEQIVLRCNEFSGFEDAARCDVGIAAIISWCAEARPGLQRLIEPPSDWSTDLWLVTHRDMHRTQKVQLFLCWLKQELARLPAQIGAVA